MTEQKPNDGKQAAGLLPISVELLRNLLHLPSEVRIVCAIEESRPGLVTLRLEGGDLPRGDPDGNVPEINAVYETINVPRFIRFEDVDAGR